MSPDYEALADDYMTGYLLSDDEEAELERLTFLERTADLPNELVYPALRPRDVEE